MSETFGVGAFCLSLSETMVDRLEYFISLVACGLCKCLKTPARCPKVNGLFSLLIYIMDKLVYYCLIYTPKCSVMCGSRGGGGTGGLDPPEKSQNIGFLSNTGPDPLKNHKATMPAFNVGPSSARQRNAI